MNAVLKPKETNYFTDDMSNEEYHKPEHGLSTSTIKNFMEDPASLIWGRSAPQDKTKLDAVNFGTDFHAYFLEPEMFEREYKVLPEFNRRIKAEKQAELDLIAQWEKEGITATTHEDMAKLKSMRDSALAHPTVAAIMKLNGIAERSFFWDDDDTGITCKCRPDWLVLDIDDSNRPPFMSKDQTTLVMDVKTMALLDKAQNQIEERKYFVQDAFYTDGVEKVTNSKVCFVFVLVSTSLSLGRYPVKVVKLTDTARFDGRRMIKETLSDYAALQQQSDDAAWQSVVTMDRPAWATREEDIY